MIDKNEIQTALRLWFCPGDVFEVRVLEAITSDYMRPHVESGYFDYEHIDVVPTALAKLRGCLGVYVTVNPVNAALLARAANRLKAAGKSPTTSDADILCRRWLLIDCDAQRPSGISSNDAEHDAALNKALEIQQGLTTLNWAEPIIMDSGNGAQLMYKIDLPADDENLVQKCLEEISKASDDKVKIDLSVHNPARIWRLPGTMNCKGDSMPDRPHRMAKIVSYPKQINTVKTAQIREIIGDSGEKQDIPPDHIRDENTHSEFNLDEWIARYCPDIKSPETWKDGRRWIFPVCPFNSAHDNKSAVLLEMPGGAISFTCHHNGCIGNDWHRLRELKEPGCYDRQIKDNSDINLSGILNQGKPLTEKQEDLFPNPGPVPDKLLSVPGFIDDVMKLTLTTAPYPNRVLAFTGALALLAFLAGRKVQDKRDNRSNIYLIALADSGTGKDHPRKVNFNIAFRSGVANCVGDAFASGEGLEDALFMHPSMLFQADEFDCIFNTLKYSKDARAESINEKLLKFYGSSNTIYPMRKKALVKKKNSENREEISHIMNPNLVLLGTAIPQYFYESLSRRVLENGLTARCIIIESGNRGDAGNPCSITPSDALIRAANYLVNLDLGGNLSNENPRPLIISETPEATIRLKEIQIECDTRYDFFEAKNEAGAKALWARAHEKVCKLAMLHGISSNVYDPLITEKSVEWAWKFIGHLNNRMLFMANLYVYENVFDEKCQKIVRYLQQTGGSAQHSVLLKRSKESLDVFKRIIDTLKANGTLDAYTEKTKTRTAAYYRLL